jgi:hypothetical protein
MNRLEPYCFEGAQPEFAIKSAADCHMIWAVMTQIKKGLMASLKTKYRFASLSQTSAILQQKRMKRGHVAIVTRHH